MSKNNCKSFKQARAIAGGLRAAGNSVAADAYLKGYYRRNQIEFAAQQEQKKNEQL